MKNLKKFENFDGFAADEEADQMKLDQAFGERDAQDEHDAHDAQYSQNDEEPVDVLARFEEEFGDNEPSSQELMEFYHKLRTEGVDGIEIFDTLLSNNKIGEGDDENYSDEDEEYDNYENDEDDSDYISGYDDESRVEDEEQYERRSLKRFNNFTTNYRMLSEGNVSTLNPELEKEFWKDLKAKYDLDDSMATMSFSPDGIKLKPKDYKAWADKYTKGKQLRGSENLVDTKAKQMAKYINKKYGNNAKSS